jgi:hypothetical protein
MHAMGRPKLKTRKLPVKLTLSPDLRAEAETLAYENNESLSALVARLLGEEIARRARPGLDPAARRAAKTDAAIAKIRHSLESQLPPQSLAPQK